MKTCHSRHQRPFDPLWVRCALPPFHPESHHAKYLTLDGRPGLIWWRNDAI